MQRTALLLRRLSCCHGRQAANRAALVCCAACNQAEVDAVFKAAKSAGKGWAKTPLWKRAEYLHKVAALMKANAQVRAPGSVAPLAACGSGDRFPCGMQPTCGSSHRA